MVQKKTLLIPVFKVYSSYISPKAGYIRWGGHILTLHTTHYDEGKSKTPQKQTGHPLNKHKKTSTNATANIHSAENAVVELLEPPMLK